MKNCGKNINLFLMDGKPDGRIKCSIANWTGIAYKIPRVDIEKCKERKDLKQSGVYFLFSISEISDKNSVYIGQAGARKNGDGLLNRLQEHKRNPDKDYWTEAVVFTTSNNSFGPTEISYLENRFCNIAYEIRRYEVKNGNDPNSGNITEEKESELEEFIEFSKLIMGTLGYKVFVPLNDEYNENISINNTKPNDTILYLSRKIQRSGNTVSAKCKQTSEGFVLLSGSIIEETDAKAIPPTIKELRKQANIDKNHVLQEDILFKSPSYASAFVVGGNDNGLKSWKTLNGKNLKSIEENC